MMTQKGLLKCDDCGRFVRLQDLYDAKAIHRMLTPSSALTEEDWETVCAKCAARELATTPKTAEC